MLGKVAKDLGEPKANVPRDVLEEGERGVALDEDAQDVGPQVPFILLASALAGDAEGLARVAGEDEVDLSSPRSTVDLREVPAPHRSSIQRALFLTSQENGRGEEVPLDEQCSPASGYRET